MAFEVAGDCIDIALQTVGEGTRTACTSSTFISTEITHEMLSEQMRMEVGGVAPRAAAVLQLLLIDKKLTAAVSEFDFLRHKVAQPTSCFLPERHNAFCSVSSVTQ